MKYNTYLTLCAAGGTAVGIGAFVVNTALIVMGMLLMASPILSVVTYPQRGTYE